LAAGHRAQQDRHRLEDFYDVGDEQRSREWVKKSAENPVAIGPDFSADEGPLAVVDVTVL
jgi:hypothetical protein